MDDVEPAELGPLAVDGVRCVVQGAMLGEPPIDINLVEPLVIAVRIDVSAPAELELAEAEYLPELDRVLATAPFRVRATHCRM